MVAGEPSREELKAAVAARRELGGEYEDAVLDSFLDRMDSSISARVDSRVADRLAGRGGGSVRTGHRGDDPGGRAFVLGLVSLGTGIPISGIAGGTSGIGGLVVAWAGIAAVNLAHALQNRHR